MTVHAFVDETKNRGYLVAAAVITPDDLVSTRRTLAGLVLPGTRRLHFAKEGPARRGQIVNALVALPVEVVIFDGSGHRDGRAQRAACLAGVVGDLAKRGARWLVIERDDSIMNADLRVLYREVRLAGCAESLCYQQSAGA